MDTGVLILSVIMIILFSAIVDPLHKADYPNTVNCAIAGIVFGCIGFCVGILTGDN